jgi:hypothetical protein
MGRAFTRLDLAHGRGLDWMPTTRHSCLARAGTHGREVGHSHPWCGVCGGVFSLWHAAKASPFFPHAANQDYKSPCGHVSTYTSCEVRVRQGGSNEALAKRVPCLYRQYGLSSVPECAICMTPLV